MHPTALIADDEPLLARALGDALNRAWPELRQLTPVTNGPAALATLREPGADVAFLDIRMPGATGLDVARILVEDWEDEDRPPPLVVFVTAYDEHALEAFEHAAVDYLLKPVNDQRLAQCVQRLKARLDSRRLEPPLESLTRQMRALLGHEGARSDDPAGEAGPLRTIAASVGQRVQMIPVESVRLFEAADKYVIVHHAEGEALIREPLRELLPRLDPVRFRQIHRGSIVNLDHVEAAEREDNGRMRLVIRGLDTRPVVSRLYAHLFRPM